MNGQSAEESKSSETSSSSSTSRVALKVLAICIVASLSGLMSGLDIGVISGVLKPFAQQFHATTLELEWVVGGMLVGATVGALGAGVLSYEFGRKYSLVIAAGVFVLGAAGCALSWSVASMIGFRIIVGMGIGLSDFAAPLYLSEIARADRRGAMVSTYQLMKTVGILMAFVSNSYLSYTNDWRWMLGIVALPAFLFLVGVLFLPNSPRWLMMRGRYQEAREVLLSLRDDPSAALEEISAIREQLKVKQKGFSLFRENSNFRRSVGLGIALQVIQQLAGINIIMYYAPHILESANFGAEAQMWCTAAIGLVNMLMTLIAVRYSDNWGRKPILYAGYAVMALSMGCLAWMLHIGVSTPVSQFTALGLILVFVGGFAMSAGPLVWVLCSEIQPMAGRNLGLSISTGTNLLTNLVVGTTFLSLMENVGASNTFWLFATFNALSLIVLYFYVPETKDVSLETIEHRLMEGRRLRDIGR